MNVKAADSDPVVVGGLTPLTTIDFPGELAAVLFLQGCPWRCDYCQNAGLLARKSEYTLAWADIIALLEKRPELLDAVVFSGGEPTLQPGLEIAIRQVKAMGFKIGLHTAGIYPERLHKILPLLDWVGMDIKSAARDYPSITGVSNSAQRAWKSARLIIDSGVDYEFRTTVHPDMLNQQQLTELTDELSALGAKHFVIQDCRNAHCLDESRQQCHTPRLSAEVYHQLGTKFSRFSVRHL